MTPPLLRAADLRGAARLATDAVCGVAEVVEAMHARIASLPRLPGRGGVAPDRERTRGVTGLVYRTVRGVTRLAGGSAEALLGLLAPALPAADPHRAPHPDREAWVAALNGVLGDHLAATGNPLAIEMAFRRQGRRLTLEREALRSQVADATPRVLVLLHGLCMNDLQWRRDGHDHGEALARDHGYTPVHLHYNSGLGVAANGRLLADRMEQLCEAWPVAIERLVLVGFSMGGLVARSAIHHGAGRHWPANLDDLVCLGTPHLGAPLERAGHGVDLLLGAAPYAAPLARLGRVRSAGITDLRHGHIVDAAVDADGTARRRRAPTPLPDRTRCFAIAASLGTPGSDLKARWLGDGLVPVPSALGRHRDPGRHLDFAPGHQAVVTGTGHLGLLSSPDVHHLLRQWLA